MRPGPKATRLKRNTRKRKWTVAPKRPGYSLNNFSTINSSLKYSWPCVHRTLCRCVFVSFLCVVLWEALEMGPGEQKWASESIIYIFFVMKYGWVRSIFAIFLSPWPLRLSILTVDRLFFGMNPHQQLISSHFLLKSTVDAILTVFSSRKILVDRRYRPYSQVGESLSTVDIDRMLKYVNPYVLLIELRLSLKISRQPWSTAPGLGPYRPSISTMCVALFYY